MTELKELGPQGKRAEGLLREFASALEQTVDSVIICNKDGVITYVNPAFELHTGYTKQEAIGKTPRILKSGKQGQSFYEELWKTILAGRFFRAVFTNRKKNGVPYFEERTISPLKDSQGNITAFVSVGRDISGRKRNEEALRFAQFAMDRAPMATYWMGPDARFFYVNDAACSMLGFTREELLSMTVHDIDPDYPAESGPEFWREVKQHGSFTFEAHHRTKDGRILPVEITATYLEFDGKEYNCSRVRDITERKRAEEALRRSEANYRSLIQGAAYGIYRSTADGKFLDVNPALVAMLGYDSEAELLVANLSTEIYRDPGERARIAAQYLERWDALEVEWKRKDGAPITVRLSGRAVRDVDGTLAYLEGIAENVTEQRLLEAQFRQAQKMEAVGQLAGGVAHDFNNLLMVMRGYTELLLSRLGANDPLRRNAEEIQKAADRATSLTQQLLAFSRKQVMQPKVFGLNAVVSDTEKMLRRLVSEDIELATILAPELGRIKADPDQINQVILNLAVNARDAMPQGGKLVIETANVELTQAFARQHPGVKPGPHVLLAMSDTGTGMDAETQARIFEPFFTTKEQGKGTGLGLATVYGIVKQSGGYIWVYSELGQGTTFEIYLPRVEEAVKATEGDIALSELPPGSETVLLVEDEKDVRKLSREFLEGCGYQVLDAKDGAEALQIAERHDDTIHLLMTDVVMPRMNGCELAQSLTLLRPEIKVLYVSGYTGDAIEQHGIREQGTAFLQKPYALDALARRLRQLLEAE